MGKVVEKLPSLSIELLMKILEKCHSFRDVVVFGAITAPLHRLIAERRRVWTRFQAIRVSVLDEHAYLFVQFQREPGVKVTGRTNLRAAFVWLFQVCRPERLIIIILRGDASMQLLADTLPPRDSASSIKRLFLVIDNFVDRRQLGTAFEEVLKKMPTGINYLRLEFDLHPTLFRRRPSLRPSQSLSPIGQSCEDWSPLQHWLQDCSQLEHFCGEVVPNSANAFIAMALKQKSKLVSLSCNLMNDVLNFNTSAAIRHICCSSVRWPAHLLAERARENVRSMCCIPLCFPNCRRISVSGGGERLTGEHIEQLANNYRNMHPDGTLEKLRLTVYKGDKEKFSKTPPQHVTLEFVADDDDDFCEVERRFDNTHNSDCC